MQKKKNKYRQQQHQATKYSYVAQSIQRNPTAPCDMTKVCMASAGSSRTQAAVQGAEVREQALLTSIDT